MKSDSSTGSGATMLSVKSEPISRAQNSVTNSRRSATAVQGGRGIEKAPVTRSGDGNPLLVLRGDTGRYCGLRLSSSVLICRLRVAIGSSESKRLRREDVGVLAVNRNKLGCGSTC